MDAQCLPPVSFLRTPDLKTDVTLANLRQERQRARSSRPVRPAL